MALTCCTISSTLILHLHLTILHDVRTQTTTVSLLQLVSGGHHAVTSNIMLYVSQVGYYDILPVSYLTNCLHNHRLFIIFIEFSFYPHIPVGMLRIYRLLFLSVFARRGLTQGDEMWQDG